MKARRARLDPKGTERPLTQIVPQVKPGKLNVGDNITSYELHHTNPHPSPKEGKRT